MKSLVAFILLIFFSSFSFAKVDRDELMYQGNSNWLEFKQFMEQRQEEDQKLGVSYLLSGALATVGGVVGYYSSEDAFSRGIYALSQSIGVAALGYGASYMWIGNEYNSFFYAVDGARLSPQQKNELLHRFLEREQLQRERQRWIKIATHSVIAAVNLYSATREEDKNIKTVFQFLAAANVVIALTYSF